MKQFTVTTALLALTLVLSACNTVSGMGKDIQRGGEILEGAANK